jgi:hypothetical protein
LTLLYGKRNSLEVLDLRDESKTTIKFRSRFESLDETVDFLFTRNKNKFKVWHWYGNEVELKCDIKLKGEFAGAYLVGDFLYLSNKEGQLYMYDFAEKDLKPYPLLAGFKVTQAFVMRGRLLVNIDDSNYMVIY